MKMNAFKLNPNINSSWPNPPTAMPLPLPPPPPALV